MMKMRPVIDLSSLTRYAANQEYCTLMHRAVIYPDRAVSVIIKLPPTKLQAMLNSNDPGYFALAT